MSILSFKLEIRFVRNATPTREKFYFIPVIISQCVKTVLINERIRPDVRRAIRR